MKTDHKTTFGKKFQYIAATVSLIPGDKKEKFGEAENQEINKDSVIGGADDVHRENPTDDLRDSDLVDTEPLQEDIDRTTDGNEQTDKDDERKEQHPPSDSEEENLDISNLEDSEDVIDEH